MNGRRVALVAASLSLAAVSSAQAAVHVAGPYGGSAPKFLTSEGHNLVTGDRTVGDPTPFPEPDLTVDPGSTLTITVTDQPHTEVTATVDETPLALTASASGTYAATLPSTLTSPAALRLQLRNQTAQVDNRTLVGLRLVAPTPPAAPAPPTPEALPEDRAPSVTGLELRGRRLTAVVACPSACVGYLTLRTKSIRIARFDVSRAGTLTATLRPAAVRHFRRRDTKRLRVLLTIRGRAPVATTVALKR